MDYKIIVASDKYESEAVKKIEQKVKKYIDSGWKLYGGISVSRSDTNAFKKVVFAQAMIKEE